MIRSLTRSTINNEVWYQNMLAGNAAFIPGIQATGGTITTTGGYRYHTFTSSGTFTLTSNPLNQTLDYLLVAGGGGAQFVGNLGFSASGGGGAGGLIYASSTVSPGNHTITIGAGGSGLSNGNNSSFGSFGTAIGGGFGACHTTSGNGGSGGGNANNTAGLGTSGQGNNGFMTVDPENGGGGGGRGAAANSRNGGNGAQYLDFANASGINTGSGFFAGGGGGGTVFSSSPGLGGAGGGGRGGEGMGRVPAGNGMQNSGGGGGGGARRASIDVGESGAGGSGLVIVRYLA